jgi:hypothetical protein
MYRKSRIENCTPPNAKEKYIYRFLERGGRSRVKTQHNTSDEAEKQKSLSAALQKHNTFCCKSLFTFFK